MANDLLLLASADERRTLELEAEALVDRAVAMVERARLLVSRDRHRSAPLLMARRAELCRHLQVYQRFKHHRIFDPVVRHGTASSRMVARVLKAECIQMGQRFGDYHGRWQRYEAPEWSRYCRDMLDTTGTLLAHLDQERNAIRKLLMIAQLHHGRDADPAGSIASRARAERALAPSGSVHPHLTLES